jgi:hypothetical protein
VSEVRRVEKLPVGGAPNDAIGKVIEWMLFDAPTGAEIDVTGSDGRRYTLTVTPADADAQAAAFVAAPLEPSTAMAAWAESRALDYGIDFEAHGGDEAIRAIYQAMLKAAQAARAQEGGR